MTAKFMTAVELARAEKHKRICSRYSALTKENPTVSSSRIITAIGDEEHMTTQGIKKILINNGLYTVKKRN